MVFLSVAVTTFHFFTMPYLQPRKKSLNLLNVYFYGLVFSLFLAALPYAFRCLFIFYVSQLYHHL